jgi:hypothetical protein
MGVIWTEGKDREMKGSAGNVKRATELQVGDHILDKSGKEFEVTEVRRDPFAPTARWIVIRLRDVNDATNEGEICCTSSETFQTAQAVTQ